MIDDILEQAAMHPQRWWPIVGTFVMIALLAYASRLFFSVMGEACAYITQDVDEEGGA